MICIKAFEKDMNGYYCWPEATAEKFYYEKGVTYSISRHEVVLGKWGFHCVNGTDISKIVDYYTDIKDLHYGLVEVSNHSIVNRNEDILVTCEITVKEFLPDKFDVLHKYDKTGKWIYSIGKNAENFDFENGFNALIKADKKGTWIVLAGIHWEQFNFEKGLDALITVDKTGEWIAIAGKKWTKFNYEKSFEVLLNVDKNGAPIAYAGKYWKVFNNNRALKALEKIGNENWIKYAKEKWPI